MTRPEKERVPLAFVRPRKPLSEMSDDELREFAHDIGALMVARMDAERAIAEEGARSRETAERAGTEAGGEDTDR
ncbi:MAG: hypothetical protein WCH74_13875 [Chloroflexota bacterium]